MKALIAKEVAQFRAKVRKSTSRQNSAPKRQDSYVVVAILYQMTDECARLPIPSRNELGDGNRAEPANVPREHALAESPADDLPESLERVSCVMLYIEMPILTFSARIYNLAHKARLLYSQSNTASVQKPPSSIAIHALSLLTCESLLSFIP